MNRRQFLKDGALAVVAVSVAPAAVLAAKELMIDGDAVGPIPVVFGQFRIHGSEVFTQDHATTEAAIEEMEDWIEEKHEWSTPICIGGIIDSADRQIQVSYLQFHTVIHCDREPLRQWRTFDEDMNGKIAVSTDWQNMTEPDIDPTTAFWHGVTGAI